MKLADSVGHVRIATNAAWTLNTGYLVLFMQAGFALLTCGLVRRKNAAHLMMLNFAAYVFAFLAYYAVGYAFQFGAVAVNAAPANLGGTPTLNQFLIGSGQWGFLGGKGFFLSGPAYDAGSNVLTLFQVVFMETAGYIIVGAICERITFWGVSSSASSSSARSSIRSSAAGCGAAAGCRSSARRWTWVTATWISPVRPSSTPWAVSAQWRSRSFSVRASASTAQDGKPVAFPAHNLVFVVTGTFILLVWLDGVQPGFHARRHRSADFGRCHQHESRGGRRIGVGDALLVSTLFGKPDITMACNGMLAGLVAITAPCAFVGPNAAVIIGIIAGVMVCGGVLFNERVLKVDDPCGAISVHGFCGWFGAVAVGIFADGTYGAGWNGVGAATYLGKAGQGVTGLLYGDVSQFLVQLGGATLCAVYAFGLTYVVFKAVNAIDLDARQQGGRARRAGCSASSACWRIRRRKGFLPNSRSICNTRWSTP